jgi:hypothetical protein
MDGANGQTGGKNGSTTFVLTAFISFGTFIIHPGIGSSIEFWVGMRLVNAWY